MKQLLTILLLLCGAAFAQNPGQITPVTTTPTGACGSTSLRLLTPNGTIYSCQNGMWGSATGGTGPAGPAGPVGSSASATLTGTGASASVTITTNFGTANHPHPTCLDETSGTPPYGEVFASAYAVGANSDTVYFTTPPYPYSGQIIVCSASSGGAGSSAVGTVTSFSSGNLSPLFTTSVATATTTPAQTFAISNAAQNSVLAGPATGGAGAYSFQTAPTISAANMTSFPTLNQNTTGTAAGITSGALSIADTTVAVTGATQGANSCSSATTVTISGLTTSMVVLPGYSASPAALTGWGSTGGVVFQAWPSAANTLSWIVCNQTASGITYSSITFNLGVR
jgi:hypothetical protein